MRTRIKNHKTKNSSKSRVVAAVGILIALLLGSACQSSVGSANSVQGTVNYLENLELTDDAVLRVSLRDTSYADAAAELIAEQVITNPGQVPIKFNVEYDPDDLDPRNTYSISARIIEAGDRLAFINDTAYDVVTGGNPSRVNMLLVMATPPPDPTGQWNESNWRTWVEAEVPGARGGGRGVPPGGDTACRTSSIHDGRLCSQRQPEFRGERIRHLRHRDPAATTADSLGNTVRR